MPESEQHARLVRSIITHLELCLDPINEIMVRDDSLQPIRGERPPRIGNFVPDVYASDVPTTRTVIGEAKTPKDLETDHSRQQIAAFLDHLAHTPNGLFILAVPPSLKPRARWLVKELGGSLGSKVPKTEVIDCMGIGLE